MEKRLATINDLDNLKNFYQEVIDHQEKDDYGADWHMGVYPSDQDFLSHINNKEFYIGLDNDNIAAATVLTNGDDPIYSKVVWHHPVDSEDVTIIHLFTVSPNYRRKGYSKEMLEYIIALARDKGFKAIHLDVAYGNIPAEKLYAKLGFELTDTLEVYYEDTGDMKVDVMELIL